MVDPRTGSWQLNSGVTFEIVHADMTRFSCDAIVNAANSRLRHFGGLAAAIVSAGGNVIQEESDLWLSTHGAIDFDHCAVTSAGSLPCQWIIHAVGPQWGEGCEEIKLHRTYQSSFSTANCLGVHHLAVPPISTGIFGVPKAVGARALSAALFDQCNWNNSSVKLVSLVIIDLETFQVFFDHFQAGGS